MATSQNGWPVVGPDAIDNSPILGHVFPNGFLKGDVFAAFKWLFTEIDARVEKIGLGNPPDEWGYYVKKIEGSNTISNHASGTAGDYNASRHPMGKHNTFSSAQRSEIHKILQEAKGIFRWGGDYTGRPDEMHFEIVASPSAVHAFVVSLSPQKGYKLDLSLNGLALPTLHKGDDDSKKGGYNYVGRAQLMLNFTLGLSITCDGVYGNQTADAVKRLPSPSNGDGSTIGLTEWKNLYGLAAA